MIEIFDPSLFGRHVGNRASTRYRQPRGCWIHTSREQDGHTEVEQLDASGPGDEDVRRLDIAVHDAFGVRRVERFGNLRPEIEEAIGRQRTAAARLR